MKKFYPAIFRTEDEGYTIMFPDVEGCVTQGESLEDGYEMAVDALALQLSYYIDNKIELPKSSQPNEIQLQNNEFVAIIEFDVLQYKKKHDSAAVKKTLTIPSWLNELAIEKNINFSQALQEALLNKVNM